MFKKLTEKLDSFLDMGTVGFDMCIFKDGECVYRHKNGFSDRENNIETKGDELYYIYSVCKLITVTAALQLYERGIFDLDDPISKYHPDFLTMKVRVGDEIIEAKNQITVRDLFRMTAGFNYRMKGEAMVRFAEETQGVCPTHLLPKYLATATLDFEPGTRWQYSLCHDLLAAFVEIWSGERFGDYVKRNIFDVAKMENSSFCLSESDRARLAPQYKYDSFKKQSFLTEPTNVYSMWEKYESGGGGCVSTVDDMIRFGEALRLGKLLKPETLELMTTNQISHCQDSFILTDYSYGLGVRCSRNGQDSITDFGWGGAAGASIWIDPKNGITAFYAQHVLNTPVIKERNKLFYIVKDCLGLALSNDNSRVEINNDAFSSKFGN